MPMEALLAAQSGDFARFRDVITSSPEKGKIVDNNGYSAAHWSAYYDDIDIFLLQLEAHPQQIAMTTNGGLSPLHICALCNSKRILRYILQKRPCVIDLRTRYGETALHLAASVGNCDIVQELVDSGADCESADQWQRTPYQVAVVNGNAAVASYLAPLTKTPLRDEVTVSAQDTEYHQMMRNKLAKELQLKLTSKEPDTMLSEPVVQNIYNTSKLQAPPPASRDTKPLSLSQLIEYPGDPHQLETLLQTRKTASGRDIDINGKDMFGLTALHKICSWNKIDLLQILLPYLSSEQINTPSTVEGSSPLHFCIEYNALQTLRILLNDTRVDTGVKDKRNLNYIELAASKQMIL